MSSIQVVVPNLSKHMRSLAQHMLGLQEAGQKIVVVTANRPYSTIIPRLVEIGVDADAVHFVDAVSCANGYEPPERPPNVTFLQSPTMLEMMAMRTEQVAVRQGEKSHVLVDNLNSLALYNGMAPVLEFSLYLANRLRARDLPADFVTLDNEQGAALGQGISTFVDGSQKLPDI